MTPTLVAMAFNALAVIWCGLAAGVVESMRWRTFQVCLAIANAACLGFNLCRLFGGMW